MSTVIRKAPDQRELLQALYNEVSVKELEETNLGVLTPVRASEKVVLTPLLPPATQSRVSKFLKNLRSTRATGGLLFVEKVVVVFTPHCPDDAVGEVEIWLHDTLLPHLNSVGDRVRIKLNGGPRLIAFYPPYSIPLADMSLSHSRCLCVVSELHECNYVRGGSPFSLFLMWSPRIEAVSHNYLQRKPENLPVCRQNVKSALSTLAGRQAYLAGARSNRFAIPVLPPQTNGEGGAGEDTRGAAAKHTQSDML
nr:putative cell-to-cell movement protein [Carrot umbravirus 3]